MSIDVIGEHNNVHHINQPTLIHERRRTGLDRRRYEARLEKGVRVRALKGHRMAFIDIFSWIVLLVVVALIVAIFVVLGVMPGRIARKRGHPWAEAVAVGSWATLVFG